MRVHRQYPFHCIRTDFFSRFRLVVQTLTTTSTKSRHKRLCWCTFKIICSQTTQRRQLKFIYWKTKIDYFMGQPVHFEWMKGHNFWSAVHLSCLFQRYRPTWRVLVRGYRRSTLSRFYFTRGAERNYFLEGPRGDQKKQTTFDNGCRPHRERGGLLSSTRGHPSGQGCRGEVSCKPPLAWPLVNAMDPELPVFGLHQTHIKANDPVVASKPDDSKAVRELWPHPHHF